MSDTPTTPHTVYYNSACPVCDAGVCAMRARIAEGEVEWVDVHRHPERLDALGLQLEDVRERLHLVDAQGRLQIGAPALLTTWSLQRRWGWLLWPLGLPGLRTLTAWAYTAFARQLYRWNRRRGALANRSSKEEEMTTHTNFDAAELDKFQALAARWWDPQSEFWPLHALNPHRLEWIDRLATLAGKRTLDVGCGGGILAEAMAHRGAAVLGIDLADKGLKVATLHAASSQAAVTYRHVAAEALAAETPAAFDVVTCMEMLEHVPDPAQVVAACSTLLKPGGWAFFSTINRSPLSWLIAIFGAERLLQILPRGTHDFAKFIRPAELKAMASAAGLVLHEEKGLRYNPLTRSFRLGNWTGVNYLLAMRKVGALP